MYRWPGTRTTIDQVPSELAYGPAKKMARPSNSLDRSSKNVSRRPRSGLLDFTELSVALSQSRKESETGASSNNATRWGYQLEQDEVRLRCMKLFLDPDQDIPEYISKTEIHAQLKKSKKSAEAAVADYLTEMFKHARQTLIKRYGEYFISTTKIAVCSPTPSKQQPFVLS